MPKNKGAGGKNRRKGKGVSSQPKELIYKDDGQEYGQITKSLGNGYMEVMCFTTNGNVLRRAHIRGKIRKRIWMAIGDIVLISVRYYHDTICDIIVKYTSDEAKLLRQRNQLPENIDINKKDTLSNDDSLIFGDDLNDNNSDDYVDNQNRNLDMPSNDSDEGFTIDDI